VNITLGGKNYSALNRLDAFTQLHVSRKLAPALPLMQGMVNPANAEKDKTLLTVLMLSNVSDDDVEYIIKKCLSVVTREQEGGRQAKIQSSDGSLMFDDIKMEDMLKLTFEIVEENLGDFFRDALSVMTPEKPTES
jgi:hypothetical protein